MKLSERLAALAAMVPAGSRLADIGTDHAYLPLYLVQYGMIPFAVAGDIHQGPYCAAQDAVRQAGCQQQIAVRLGDGLAVITPGEVDTAVIAGMGASTMIRIFTDHPEILYTLKRLVVQPMVAAAAIRRWLSDNGWRLTEENLVTEEGRLYELLAAEPGRSEPVEPILYEIGPLLWRDKHPLLIDHIDQLLQQWQRVVQAMSASDEARQSAKYLEYTAKVRDLEAYRQCL